jgi:hypothetical protein
MAEQTEERPFTADIADLFQREAVGDTAGVDAYTMTLRCMSCYVEMVPQLPATEGTLPALECPKCHIAVEVSFS